VGKAPLTIGELVIWRLLGDFGNWTIADSIGSIWKLAITKQSSIGRFKIVNATDCFRSV
jgi:hypothetical protein